VQRKVGVTPDLTALAKILAGGLPGGAVVGRADVMSGLGFGADATKNRTGRVAHAGTYNANPLSAAAGIAMLSQIADGEYHRQADRAAGHLREALGGVWKRLGIPGCIYGEASIVNYSLERDLSVAPEPGARDHRRMQALACPDAYHVLRCALILNGVDIAPLHGWVSAIHTDEDIERAVQGFEKALGLMREDGFFSGC
jgi:glutamate-1-semialdehyde 2,1-aminomutase